MEDARLGGEGWDGALDPGHHRAMVGDEEACIGFAPVGEGAEGADSPSVDLVFAGVV